MNLVDKGLRAALRQGWDRGIVGGSDAWLVVGAMALGARETASPSTTNNPD